MCLFVNDTASAEVIDILADNGTKFIAMRCAGFDRVDLDHCAARGIRVARVPTYSPASVAEHALALMLTLSKYVGWMGTFCLYIWLSYGGGMGVYVHLLDLAHMCNAHMCVTFLLSQTYSLTHSHTKHTHTHPLTPSQTHPDTESCSSPFLGARMATTL